MFAFKVALINIFILTVSQSGVCDAVCVCDVKGDKLLPDSAVPLCSTETLSILQLIVFVLRQVTLLTALIGGGFQAQQAVK